MVLLRRADGDRLKRVLLIATTTGYQIRSFGEAAAKLDIQLVFASDRCDQIDDPWWDQAIPVRFHDELRSIEAVVAACGDQRPDGIVAVGDRPAVLAAHLAKRFGLPGHPPHGASVSRNKLQTRKALSKAGLPTPTFESVPVDADPHSLAPRVRYPAVIKPEALSGSRGVMRVNNETEFVTGFERLRSLLASVDVQQEHDDAHDSILIESFIPGREFAVEGLLTHGALQRLAIFDKPDPLDGPFFEETVYLTPSGASADDQERIWTSIAAAASAVGLFHGPIHAECRVDSGIVHVLEVAARPIGGLCSRALRFRDASNPGRPTVSLEEVLLQHAVGTDVGTFVREDGASGVMMIPIPRRGIFRRVEGVTDAISVPGVEDVSITTKADASLVPLPEGKSYLGFVFARGENPTAIERALREAHRALHFVIDRDVPVLR